MTLRLISSWRTLCICLCLYPLSEGVSVVHDAQYYCWDRCVACHKNSLFAQNTEEVKAVTTQYS